MSDKHKGERVKTWLYGLLSALLLFTAAIVLNIESVRQKPVLDAYERQQ